MSITLGQKLFTLIEKERPLTEEEKKNIRLEKERKALTELFSTIQERIEGIINGSISINKNDFKNNAIRVFSNRDSITEILKTPEHHYLSYDIDKMFEFDEIHKPIFLQFKKWLSANEITLICHFEYNDSAKTWGEIYMKPSQN